MTESDSASDQKMPVRKIAWIGLAWAMVVSAVLVWQAYNYTGIYASIAEWQFRNFERLYPIATIALIVALLSLPFVLIIIFRKRRRRQLYGSPPGQVMLRREGLVSRSLAGLAIAAGLIALGLAIAGLAIGGLGERPLTNLSFAPDAAPTSGDVKSRAVVMTNRIGYYREGNFLAGRDLYVAPIAANTQSTNIKYFLEIQDRAASPARVQDITGFMKAQALPGGLEQLYENAGYEIDDRTYVIFEDRASARWPLLSAAGAMALMALLLAIGFALQKLYLRRQVNKRRRSANPDA